MAVYQFPIRTSSHTQMVDITDQVQKNEQMQPLAEHVDFSFWEKQDETHSVVRFATSWATEMEDVRRLGTFL